MTSQTIPTSQAPRVVCPPGCKHSDAGKMHEHDVDVDIDGRFVVSHEVDFGEWTFGSVVQRFDGMPEEKLVTVSEGGPGDFDDPADVRRLAADLMDAADWLESVQVSA